MERTLIDVIDCAIVQNHIVVEANSVLMPFTRLVALHPQQTERM